MRSKRNKNAEHLILLVYLNSVNIESYTSISKMNPRAISLTYYVLDLWLLLDFGNNTEQCLGWWG